MTTTISIPACTSFFFSVAENIYIYICIYIYRYRYLLDYMHTYSRAYSFVYTHTCTHKRTQRGSASDKFSQIPKHGEIYTYMNTYLYIHVCNIHTHTPQRCSERRLGRAPNGAAGFAPAARVHKEPSTEGRRRVLFPVWGSGV